MGKLRLDPWLYYFAALLVLTLPLNWLLAALAAAAVHELCHLAAVRALGGEVLEIRVRPGGAVIDAALPEKGRALLAALAGPAGSLLLLSLCRWFPRLSLCGAVQGLFNLLPVRPLDGGRALELGLDLLCPKWTGRVLFAAGILVFLAAALAVWTFFGRLALLMLVTGWICCRFLRKRPCKAGRIGVQ